MLKFKLVNATTFDVMFCLEDMGSRRHVIHGIVTETPTGGQLVRIGGKWQARDVPFPILHSWHRKQITDQINRLNDGIVAERYDPNKLANFKRDWQQMAHVEKSHETIKGAATTVAAAKAELSLITGNPAGWQWDDNIGDYIKVN